MDNTTNKIKDLRQSKNLSRRELSDEIGVSISSIESYELGRRVPSLETFSKLADYFDVSIPYIMGTQHDKYIIADDANILTNMDSSPDMMEQAKLADTQKAAVAFNRVLFWLDNEVLDESTSKPTKNEEVRQKEKELISLLKNTFEAMREDFLGGINHTISEPQKYIEGIEYYKRNFIMMQEFNKLNEDDKLDLMLSIKKLRQIELDQNKKASDD